MWNLRDKNNQGVVKLLIYRLDTEDSLNPFINDFNNLLPLTLEKESVKHVTP